MATLTAKERGKIRSIRSILAKVDYASYSGTALRELLEIIERLIGEPTATPEEPALKFHEALTKAGIEYAGLSTEGLNIFGDRKSIDAAKRWLHDSQVLPEIQQRLADARRSAA